MGQELVEGRFIARLNRFLCRVEVRGSSVSAFLPNPGRLKELLTLSARVILKGKDSSSRKTGLDILAVYHGDEIVSVDSRLPNRLVAQAISAGYLKPFAGYRLSAVEYPFLGSRFDFMLSKDGESCLLEVKSCTLVREGLALFPDAPTSRGSRHLADLVRAKNRGYHACVLFVIQRRDAEAFSPNGATDPRFRDALCNAWRSGVEVYAYKVKKIDRMLSVELGDEIPVVFPEEPRA